jgi:hypothetical protein
MKLFLSHFSSLHAPLPTFGKQKGTSLRFIPATQTTDIAAHQVVGKVNQHIPHIKKARTNRHGIPLQMRQV